MTTGEEYDRKLRNLILYLYKKGYGEREDKHLEECAEAEVVLDSVEAFTGTYGCDTGCDMASLEGTVTCPHGVKDEIDADSYWGAGSGLEDIMSSMDELEATGELSGARGRW